MAYLPFNTEKLNLTYSKVIPSSIQTFNTYSYDYWERLLFMRVCYSLNITTPELNEKERSFLLYCLYKFGYVAIWKDEEMGLLFQPCSLKGYDFYYQPTNAIITNPRLSKTLDLKIGEECELLRLTPDYMGVWDLITYYAQRLSTLDPSIDVSIINSKVPFIAWGKSRSALASLRKLFDKINQGNPTVFIDQRVQDDDNGKPIEMFDRPHLKDSYIVDKLLSDRATLLREFDREVGISTVPYEKKERLTGYESESMIQESQAKITIWLECLRKSMDQVNAKYNTNFKVERRRVDESVYDDASRSI